MIYADMLMGRAISVPHQVPSMYKDRKLDIIFHRLEIAGRTDSCLDLAIRSSALQFCWRAFELDLGAHLFREFNCYRCKLRVFETMMATVHPISKLQPRVPSTRLSYVTSKVRCCEYLSKFSENPCESLAQLSREGKGGYLETTANWSAIVLINFHESDAYTGGFTVLIKLFKLRPLRIARRAHS